MHIDYWLLSTALLLLWFPRQWLRAGGAKVALPNVRRLLRVSTSRDPLDYSLQWRDEFFKLRNWIDLFRAAIGAVAVLHMCVELGEDATAVARYTMLASQAAVLVIAVLIQTARYESRRLMLVAPVFFVFGLGFVLIGWIAALFAIVLTWVINRALPNVAMFLFVFAGLQVVFGLGLQRASFPFVVLSAGLAWLPVFWSLVARRSLERASRQRGVARS